MLANFRAANFSADGLGKLVNELDHARIFVRRGVALDVILNLLFKLLARLIALGENDRRLYDLAADRVRRSRNGTFEDCGVRYQNALDLERTYAVAAGLDNVVVAPDIPIIAVLVALGGIAGVVVAVMPNLVGELLALVVAAEKSGGLAVFALDYDLAQRNCPRCLQDRPRTAAWACPLSRAWG